MLRYFRSRAVTTKQQPLMADANTSTQSSLQEQKTHSKPPIIKSFLTSPRFKAFTTKGNFETAPLSPTSTLDNCRQQSLMIFPFGPNNNPFSNVVDILKLLSKTPKSPLNQNKHSEAIGLALVDTFFSAPNNSTSHDEKMVLFGTTLRSQIPTPVPTTSTTFQTEHTQENSLFLVTKMANDHSTMLGGFGSGCSQTEEESIEEFISLTADQIELSEDYTCVIYHGPNPKTTHIFGNCVLNSYYSFSEKYSKSAESDSFLSFCYTCKKNLHQKDDIYIYRGDKAFCSMECRYQEMLMDGEDN